MRNHSGQDAGLAVFAASACFKVRGYDTGVPSPELNAGCTKHISAVSGNRMSATAAAFAQGPSGGFLQHWLFNQELEYAMDAQWKRIEAIVGESETITFEDQVNAFYQHLLRSLELPCEVTGTEDFRWEERFVFGCGSEREYARLRKACPSYQDQYELVAIENGVVSEWMMFGGDDIGAHVKRKSDGKEFWLGLAELKGVGKKSRNTQLLHDFAVFFVNSR